MRIFNSIISAFFPNTCIACGEIIDDGESLCDYCYEMLDKVDFTKTCKRCGLTIKNCECKYRVFYFSGVAAPFYNSASAKEIMYKFKFSKATKNAEFISQQMLLAIEMVYNDINFDAVTFVPLNSPLKALTMLFSSSSPNTYIGILFSIERIDAVRSTTANFLAITSSIETSMYFLASGLVAGSLS